MKLKLSSIALLLVCGLALTACGGDDPVDPDTPNTPNKPEPTPDPTPTPETYVAPTYPDNYTSVSTWGQRKNWNLGNVHDPSVVLADDGYYYMYQTDAGYGNPHDQDIVNNKHGHFYCRRSKNLVDWEFLGATMRGLPSWIKDKHNEIRKAMGLGESTLNYSKDGADSGFGYWAPVVRKVGNVYRMYYSINMPSVGVTDDKMSAASVAPNVIGMMETTTPDKVSSWVDKGFVISQYSDKEKNYNGASVWGGYWKYNAIDPTYVITKDNRHWLIYGSWHSGFAAVELDPVTGMTKTPLGNPWGAANEAAYGKRVFTRINGDRWQGSEGPEVVYRDGYYYMFIAYGQLAVAYNTRVVRSENPDGPYKDITGKDFTNGQAGGNAYPIVTHAYKFGNDHGWVGISHCAVWDDGKGNYYYASQQRYPENYPGINASNAIMLGGVRSIIWTEDGWPLVLPERYGAVPQTAITEADLVGNWQNINLGGCTDIWDKNCKMATSVDFKLNADHKVDPSSGWNAGATWGYNASKQILTINGVKLYLKRELDWEANPRVPTIVYAGLSSDKMTTHWGKKVK